MPFKTKALSSRLLAAVCLSLYRRCEAEPREKELPLVDGPMA
jgi:hypothetical protein